MDYLLSDIRFALRTFKRRVGLMGFALLSLGLGIGASTAMFSVADSVLLRPLPFPEPEDIVSVYPGNPQWLNHPTFHEFADRGTFSLPEVYWVTENQDAFDEVGAYIAWGGPTLTGEGPPQQLSRILATPGLLRTLRVEPLHGRLFSDDDDPRNGARSVLLTEGYWDAQFARDPGVLGRSLNLNDEPYTIIGVLPGEVADATRRAQIWMLTAATLSDGNWGNHNVSGVVGRLRDGVSIEQARERMKAVLAAVPAEGAHDHFGSVFPRLEDRTRGVRPALLALVAASFLLLVVGCGNVAAILVGLGIDREREISVRGAIGAGNWRIVAQLLTEGLVLAIGGAIVGVVLAFAFTKALVFLAPPEVHRIDQAVVDGRVLLFAVTVAVGAGVVFGLVPAMGLVRSDLASAMTGARGTVGQRSRLQSALVVGELALATVLLIGSALLGRTLMAVNGLDLGLDTKGLFAVDLAVPYQRFENEDDDAEVAATDGYFESVVDAVAALPGVESVGVTNIVPLGGSQGNNNVVPEGWEPENEDEALIAERRFVSANYFQTAAIPFVEGRAFDDSDNRVDAAPVVVISEGLARRVWPDEPAVGKTLAFWGREPATIVGVAAGLRDQNLLRETEYAFYVPARQIGPQVGSLLVRIAGDPGMVIPSMRNRIWEVDPALPITRVVSIDELRAGDMGAQRYRARLMITFGLLAGLFAVLGVYAVAARSVARRTREIGVRTALGALGRDVTMMVVRQGARLAVWGVLLGIGIALIAAPWIDGMLYEVPAMDPISFSVVALLVGLVTVLACVPPGRRAAGVDPVTALRAD